MLRSLSCFSVLYDTIFTIITIIDKGGGVWQSKADGDRKVGLLQSAVYNRVQMLTRKVVVVLVNTSTRNNMELWQ